MWQLEALLETAVAEQAQGGLAPRSLPGLPTRAGLMKRERDARSGKRRSRSAQPQR